MASIRSFVRGLFERKNSVLEDVWLDLFGAKPASSGQTVNWKTALQVTTVFGCVRVLADGISTIPLKIYKKDGAGGRQEVGDHPIANLFGVQANAWQAGLEYRETIAFHLALTGNHYAYKNRASDGTILELIPFEPGSITPQIDKNQLLTYKGRTANGTQQIFAADDIWHVRGASWCGWLGLEPVRLAREAIGLALATEEHHAQLHKNGARPGGLYSVESTLSSDDHKRLRQYIEQNYEGVDNAYRTMILDRAAKFQQISMTGVDSQHLETRRFQIEEVCRAFGVNPIMVGHSANTQTYASAEQMFLAHVVNTMRPWHRRIEAAIQKDLLTPKERTSGFYPKFVDSELLRGAAKDRGEYYAKALGSGGAAGWMTPNDIRELEDMPPHADGNELPKPPTANVAGTDQHP